MTTRPKDQVFNNGKRHVASAFGHSSVFFMWVGSGAMEFIKLKGDSVKWFYTHSSWLLNTKVRVQLWHSKSHGTTVPSAISKEAPRETTANNKPV